MNRMRSRLTLASHDRRRAVAAAGLCLLATHPLRALAQLDTTPTLQARIATWSAGKPLSLDDGRQRVVLDVPALVENGNAVPLTVRVNSAMRGADRVLEILLLNELNPQRELAWLRFGALSPRAELSTRVRLATSQRLVALVRMADGSQWLAGADVVVTLAACVE